MPHWSVEQIPAQKGKLAIVTGANSGIGYDTALLLARAGASVVVAARDEQRGIDALKRLQQTVPDGSFRLEALDLADLSSVRAFASRIMSRSDKVDILINNAGIMALPKRELSQDGFEMQFATNHLGHFALTGLLMRSLKQSASPRVVTVSSGAAMIGKVELDNLQGERAYEPFRAYSQTKLANLMFAVELGKRAPWLVSVASHPGATMSNLQKYKFHLLTKLIGQSSSQGALTTVRAATDDTTSGAFFAPKDLFHMRGEPVLIGLPKSALNSALSTALWQRSEELTFIEYEF